MARVKGELLTFDNAPQKGTFTVLQTLDHKQNRYNLFLDKEKFVKNLDAWNKTPVILATKHPTINKARENLDATLAEIGGKLLGYPTDAKLETVGTPRLTANIPLSDPEAQKLHDTGKLATSPAYAADDDGERLTGDVTPDHILVFPTGPDAQPGAPSMMFGPDGKTTSQEASDMDEQKEKQFKADAEKNASALKAKEDELKAFRAEAETEHKTLLEQKAEVEKQLKAFQDKVIQDKADSEFKTFMGHVPKGWKEGKEKVKDEKGIETEIEKAVLLQKEFQSDPKALYERLLKFNEDQQPGGTPAPGQGQEHTGGAEPEKVSVGGWDAKRGKWANEK